MSVEVKKQNTGIGISMENIDNKNNKVKFENLSDRSEKDRPWDIHRKDCDAVSNLYFQSSEFEKYYERMEDCSGRLEFNQLMNSNTGELTIKLSKAHFCRVRHCPVCQWRKSLMWKARFYKALPDIETEYKSARWMFLTLTVENCEITELKKTIQLMNKSFIKMIQRKHFKKYNLGFVKTTEITRSKKGKAHPHFHVLLMMNVSYFKYGYLKTSDWAEIWRDCLNVSYVPVVDVRVVKNKINTEDSRSALADAVAETLKYAVKPTDMIKNKEWFHELNRQVFKMRFVSTGGVMKDLFKEETTEEDLLLLSDDEKNTDEDLGNIYFNWYKKDEKYKRKLS